MTSGFWDSITMTSVFSTTLVSTFCCSLVSSAPFPFAFLRIRWTAVHHLALLREESVAELRGPLDVVGEPFDDFGERGHRLDAGIPRLLRDRVGQCLVLEFRVLCQPLLQLDDLERVGGGDEGLGQQVVGIERDRRHQRRPAGRVSAAWQSPRLRWLPPWSNPAWPESAWPESAWPESAWPNLVPWP